MVKPLKILQASAGSGKTFSLAAHYLILLFSGEHTYREILAVTFTNKATEEMKTRILTVLKGLAKGDLSGNIAAYRQLVLTAHPGLTTISLQQKAHVLYRKILHDYSRFAISTIDGFVQKIIRGFAFELGLNADYRLEMNYEKVKTDLVQKLDESLSEKPILLQWIIDLALERIGEQKSWNYKAELLKLIGEVFKENYEAFEQSIHALGLENIDALFQEYIRNSKAEIKTFENTFQRYGAEALSIFESFQVDSSNLKRGSQNWLCKLAILQDPADERTLKIMALIDDPESWFKTGKEIPGLYEALNPVLRTMHAFYLDHRGTYYLANAFHKNIYYLRLMQEVALLLSDYRKENDQLLISDAQKLITGITEDAGDNPSFIWEKVGNRYRHFLFDEFQDTSVNQWKSFRSILSNAIASASGQLHDHLIVGDAKQSIYRWRNGDWNILHQQARKEIGAHQVMDHALEENYRSTATIIEFNNYLYGHLPGLLEDQLNELAEAKSEDLLEWWRDEGYDHIVRSVYQQASQQFSPVTPPGGAIKVKRFSKDDMPDETERFSETTYRQLAIDEVLSEINLLFSQGYAPREMAILVRSNTEAALCVSRLMEAQIPVLSGEALLIGSHASIQLVINTLKLLVSIDSQSALYKANCMALYHRIHRRTLSPIAYIGLAQRPLNSLSEWLPPSLCTYWSSWLQLPLAELIEHLIEAYELNALPSSISYLLAFRDLVDNATRTGEKGIIHFLSWWEEDGRQKSLPSPEQADAVQVMTIHKSKGLAFRAVFIPFCLWELKTKANTIFWVGTKGTPYAELGGIPLKFNDELGDSIVAKAYFKEVLDSGLDALNMLYVATTRAIDYLYLSVMEKKEGTKMTTIGDALTMVLEELSTLEGNSFKESGGYERAEAVRSSASPEEHPAFELTTYPTTARLSALYMPTEEKQLKHVLNIEESGRRGSLKHEVLARAGNETEVLACLEEMCLRGVISKTEIEPLKAEVMAVLLHPELKKVFAYSTESLIERNIIDENGRLHRPDRIFLRPEEVVVLDYKFTSTESNSHVEQVQLYQELLRQMGYKNVTGYLFYALTGKLKSV